MAFKAENGQRIRAFYEKYMQSHEDLIGFVNVCNPDCELAFIEVDRSEHGNECVQKIVDECVMGDKIVVFLAWLKMFFTISKRNTINVNNLNN